MPLYNDSGYVKSSILSVLYQTFQDFEILVVDDQSTDDGPEIVREMMSSDPRIRLLSTGTDGSRGVSVARNIGLDNARGEFVFFLDSDDCISCSTFEVMLREIKRTGLDMATGLGIDNSCDICDGQKILMTRFGLGTDSVICDFGMTYPFKFVWHWQCLYRRCFIEEHGLRFTEGIFYGEDRLFFVKAVSFARYVIMCGGINFYYRKDKDTIRPRYLFSLERQVDNIHRLIKELGEFSKQYGISNHAVKREFQWYEERIMQYESAIAARDAQVTAVAPPAPIETEAPAIPHSRLYPKWLINFLCWFVLKKKNRHNMREKYARK
ncbi:MAG: glycosyltransferase [Rickettsiales bacterium]|jgi:glycosyltransferase involved in cell wall biosynthesis|nr:glycosyltransferase [Rickettsiales bacterium]